MGKKINSKRLEEKELKDVLSQNREDNSIELVKNKLNSLIPYDIKFRAKNENQKKLINSIRNNQITICAGPPGSGKTFATIGYALNLLMKKNNKFKKIYLIKSVTTLKGEELGYLKGDLNDKIEPFMWSYMINLEKLVAPSSIKTLFEDEIIKPFPLAYMRGVSLDNCIIIADELQNVTLDNSKTLMTRIGSDCKLILLGDVNQIDLRNKKDSSLNKLIDIFQDTDEIGVINMNLEDAENVRNPLITTIEKKFNSYYESIDKQRYVYKNPVVEEIIDNYNDKNLKKD